MPRKVQPVEQDRRAQEGEDQRPTDPHTHTGDRGGKSKNSFISMVVGTTNDRLVAFEGASRDNSSSSFNLGQVNDTWNTFA